MAKATGVASLADYAKERQAHRSGNPWFETELPSEVQEEVIAAWRKGVRGTVIVEWLQAQGFATATKGRVNSYLARIRD